MISAFCHVPLASQACGVVEFPTQPFAPGVHAPAQAPLRQRKGQSAEDFHAPSALQTCGVKDEHRTSLGVQTPMHWPSVQANGHVSPSAQVPAELQVRSCLPLHSVDPGAHMPVQVPFEHTPGHELSLIQFPLASQRCALFPSLEH